MPAPRTDNEQLWKRYGRWRTVKHRNALIVAYMPLLERIATKMFRSLAPQTLFDRDALVNAGVPGLIDAIEKFDRSRGVYFSTFANMRIKGAILDELRKHDWVPRLERTRLKQGLIEATRQIHNFVIEHEDEGNENGYGQSFADRQPGPEHAQSIEDFWRAQLRGLDQTERLVVLLYFRQGLTMKQIGRQVGLSESRISQMTTGILHRLAQLRRSA